MTIRDLRHIISVLVWGILAVCAIGGILFVVYRLFISHPEDVVSSWSNKKIYIPEDVTCIVKGDTIEYKPFQKEFTVLRYIDSTGCTPCKLYLAEYESCVKRLSQESGKGVDFLCVVQPKEVGKLIRTLKSHDIRVPVILDDKNLISSCNKFERDDFYRTMLLDKDGRVLVIGNLMFNRRVRELYKQVILGQTDFHCEEMSYTEVEVTPRDVDLGIINRMDTAIGSVVVRNVGTETLEITSVIPSCDCVHAILPVTEISPGDSVLMELKFYDPDISGDFYREIELNGNFKPAVQIGINGYSYN